MTTPYERLSTFPDDDVYAGHPEDSSSDGGVTATAQQEAANVKDSAVSEAQDIAQTAKEQTQAVASEVRDQARALLDESRSQLTEHAGTQRDRAVESLRSLGGELDGMAAQSTEAGLGAQLAREAGQRVQRVADFMDGREPGQMLDDVRELGRRRPGAFLVGAALAGIVVGRISRGAMSARKSDAGSTTDTSTSNGARADIGPGAHKAPVDNPTLADAAPILTADDSAPSSGIPHASTQGGYQ